MFLVGLSRKIKLDLIGFKTIIFMYFRPMSKSLNPYKDWVASKSNVDIGFYVSFVFLILLSVGSLVFYKERMLFADPAFIVFEIIQSKHFVISEHRYGAFITQMFPLISTYIGIPLKWILVLYSLSFYIFFLFVGYFSGIVLKQKALAIGFILYLTLLVSDVYFWPNNEIHQAVSWMILFVSLYCFSDQNDWKINKLIHLPLVMTLFLAVISHLNVVIPLGFIWLFVLFSKRQYSKHVIYFGSYSILIIFFIGLRIWLSYNSWYDGAKLSGVKGINLEKIIAAFGNDQSSTFMQLLFKKYYFVLILFFSGILALIKERKILLMLLSIICPVVFFLIVTLTFSEAITESNLFYFESQWMGLGFLCSVPFLFYGLNKYLSKKFTLVFFGLLFVTKIPQLSSAKTKFSERLNCLKTLTQNAHNSPSDKCYIINTINIEDDFLITWGIPIETILLSSITENTKTVTVKNVNSKVVVSMSTDSIHSAFELLHYKELDNRYFKFVENSNYIKIVY